MYAFNFQNVRTRKIYLYHCLFNMKLINELCSEVICIGITRKNKAIQINTSKYHF